MIRVPVGAVAPEAAAPLLTEREAAALQAFPVEKRRAEWLAGTLAAKAAIRALRGPIPWRDMEVLNGPDKDRQVTLPPGVATTGVTLSHAAGVAVALAFDPLQERLGVDVDRIEKRPPSWLEEAFTPEERARLGDDPVAATVAWCVKEAALKALGVGLSVPLHDVTVTRFPWGAVSVELRGAALARCELLGGVSVEATAHVAGDTVTATARLRLQRPV